MRILPNKPIFYDSDVLVCFLEIGECSILKELFFKVIIPDQVFAELNKPNTPKTVRDNLKILMDEGFVVVKELKFASPEYIKYDCMVKGFWCDDGKSIGNGESAAIALAIENNGILASNNLKDVKCFCEEFDIPLITASIILAFSYSLGFNSKKHISFIWEKIVQDTFQIMPKDTFEEYYDDLFDEGCEKLLKNYNLKNHIISINNKK